MPTPVINQEGQETLNAILSRRAPIVRKRWKDKILNYLDLHMKANGATVADKSLVMKATKFVTSPAFTPHLDFLENLGKFRDRRGWNYEADSYFAAPRRVK